MVRDLIRSALDPQQLVDRAIEKFADRLVRKDNRVVLRKDIDWVGSPPKEPSDLSFGY